MGHYDVYRLPQFRQFQVSIKAFFCIIFYGCSCIFFLTFVILFPMSTDSLLVALESLVLGLKYLCGMAVCQLFCLSSFPKALPDLVVYEFCR